MMFDMAMTEDIRTQVRQKMKEEGLSTYKLAEAVETTQPNISRILSGRSGGIPKLWQKILKRLGLKLVVVRDE
jgi:predicted transcriptional regulator